ncbi:MAG: glycosyltransferase family 9 protein [Candidatus Bathyarchaeia archaeon]
MEASISDSPRKIFIIRYCGLGDFILTIPFLWAIRRSFPGAMIDLASNPSHIDLIRGMNLIDRYVSDGKGGIPYLYSETPERVLDRGFDPSQYDLVIPFTGSESVIVKNLMKMGCRKVHSVKPIPGPEDSLHVIDFLLNQAPVNRGKSNRIPKIKISDEDIERGREFLERNFPDVIKKGNVVAIHPGSGSPRKNWPVESFAELILHLMKGKRWRPFLIEGPADREIVSRINDLLGDRTPEAIVCRDLLSLSTFLLSSCLYIGNDSGVTHLSASLGCPTIAIFGPSHPGIWGPRGDSVQILWRKFPCSPCHLRKDVVCQRNICMESIGWKEVMEIIDSSSFGRKV